MSRQSDEMQTWQQARIIPTSGIGGSGEQERRASSAFLAVLGAVEEFSRMLLKPFGAPYGSVSTYCEVPFLVGDKEVRPDGLIRITRGKREWTILVEIKTGKDRLRKDQLEDYLEVCRQEKFDGLLTISNHLSEVRGAHHIEISRQRYRRIPMHHLSWFRIWSQAIMIKQHRGVSDPDQAWILGELIRYFEYSGSGIRSFDDMGGDWVQARSAVRVGALEATSDEAVSVSQRWAQLIQYVCLEMTTRLGTDVVPIISQKETDDVELLSKRIATQLASEGQLQAVIHVPSRIDRITVVADLRANIISTAVTIPTPAFKLAKQRIEWVLRQLSACADDTRLDIFYQRSSRVRSGLLDDVRRRPEDYVRSGGPLPRAIQVAVTTKMGFKRGRGSGAFIDSVADAINAFYTDLVSRLKPPSK